MGIANTTRGQSTTNPCKGMGVASKTVNSASSKIERVLQLGMEDRCRILSVGSRSVCDSHLALEHVAQVAAALGAGDLSALHAEGVVHVAVHRTRDLVIKRRPAPGDHRQHEQGVKTPAGDAFDRKGRGSRARLHARRVHVALQSQTAAIEMGAAQRTRRQERCTAQVIGRHT